MIESANEGMGVPLSPLMKTRYTSSGALRFGHSTRTVSEEWVWDNGEDDAGFVQVSDGRP